MKDKITELRIRIDGLAQLVKSLTNQGILLVPENMVPDGVTGKEFAAEFRRVGGTIIHKPTDVDPKFIYPPQHIYSHLRECHTSLILSKAWLGKVLAALGSESPYQNDGCRQTVADIEPASDKKDPISVMDDIIGIESKYPAYIEKIDWLRQEIKELAIQTHRMISDVYVDCSIDWENKDVDDMYDIDDLFKRSEQHLSEARFHLGFELQRLKESKI